MKGTQERAKVTRLKIIQSAFDLFHNQGVNATSIDEILESSGTGKSQFYYYFESKDALVHEVVQNFYNMLCNKELPVKYDIDSWDDLEEWFTFFIDYQETTKCARGCPMATIGYELTRDQELIRQDIHLTFEFTLSSLSRFFHQLKSQGKLKNSVDPKSLAELCLMVMQGGMIVSKIKKETDSFQNSVKHLISYLKSLTK